MNTQTLLTTAMVLFAGCSWLPNATANVINGAMGGPFSPLPEDPASGFIPEGWSALGAEAGRAGYYRGQAIINSPFTGTYADNSSAFVIHDTASNSNNYGIFQTFSEGFATGTAGFDFMMDNLQEGGYYSFHFNNNGDTTGGSGATLLRFYLGQDGGVGHQGADGYREITKIAESLWYHIEVTFDAPNATYSGTLTPNGGAGIAFSGALVSNPAANFSGALLRDRTDSPSGSVYLDNVYVVPEPGTVALLLGAGAGGLLFAKRRRRKG